MQRRSPVTAHEAVVEGVEPLVKQEATARLDSAGVREVPCGGLPRCCLASGEGLRPI